MTEPPQELSGRCLCGSVTYRVASGPLWQGACYCSDCQRQTGTAFSVIVGVPRAALQLEGDTLSSFTTTGEAHQSPTERHFCSNCGSPVVSLVGALPDLAFLKAGTLDDGSWLTPTVEVWTRSAQPWAPHFEGAERLQTAPGS